MEITVEFPVGPGKVTFTGDSQGLSEFFEKMENGWAKRLADLATKYNDAAPAQVAATPASNTQSESNDYARPAAIVRAGGKPEPKVLDERFHPRCDHGLRGWVSGAKAGKQYEFWACQSEEDTCRHQYPDKKRGW